MKFIHTADWHLGKLLKEHSMTEDQAWLLENRFLPIVDEEKPDVILLAGTSMTAHFLRKMPSSSLTA